MVDVAKISLTLLLLLFPLMSPAVQGETFRDPLRPVHFAPVVEQQPRHEEPPVDTSHWVLSAVLTAEDRSVAMINGRRLQVGDILEGYRLVKIDHDLAVMQKRGHRVVLRRAGTNIKKNLSDRRFGKGNEE